MEINGIAHTVLTVRKFKECTSFYDSLLPFMGLESVFKGEDMCYWIGGRTALAISRSKRQGAVDKFDQDRVGLHHLCFRARSYEDIDSVYQHLLKMKATIVHPPQEGKWAPGYYSVLFEDPEGIRLEVNHVPGKGVFGDGVTFSPGNDYK